MNNYCFGEEFHGTWDLKKKKKDLGLSRATHARVLCSLQHALYLPATECYIKLTTSM